MSRLKSARPFTATCCRGSQTRDKAPTFGGSISRSRSHACARVTTDLNDEKRLELDVRVLVSQPFHEIFFDLPARVDRRERHFRDLAVHVSWRRRIIARRRSLEQPFVHHRRHNPLDGACVPADCSVTARRKDGRRPLARAPSHDTEPGVPQRPSVDTSRRARF